MIKEGMIFLFFNGKCEQALAFYEEVFLAQVLEKTTYLQAEMCEDAASENLIMNATVQLSNLKICASDLLESDPVVGTNTSIWLEIDTRENLQQIFDTFEKVNSQIVTNLASTFWNSLYCKVQDPFGILWELNCQLP